MVGPLLFGLLVALAVVLGFVALGRMLPLRDPVEARLIEFTAGSGALADNVADPTIASWRRGWPTVSRILAGFGLGTRLATALVRADLPLTAAEFALIVVVIGVLGYVVGSLRAGLLLGLLVGLLLACVPILYLSSRQRRRQTAFTEQLPDVLTLLVGALRAGYGFTQAMAVLVDQLPPPASKEFSRVLQAVGLGRPVQQALGDMAYRVGIDDLDLVVTAVTVQYEIGGNLTQTLETIGETVRDRIRMKRQIRALTAQQRLTGYFLAVWPLLLGVAIFLLNPNYMRQLFAPGPIRLLPIAAIVMQVLGFIVIRRIVDIEV